jgi:hypothetical protein
MVLYLAQGYHLQNVRPCVKPTTAMETEQNRREQSHSRSPSFSPVALVAPVHVQQQSPRSGHEPESPASPSPPASRQCVADTKSPLRVPQAVVTGASSSKPPQAAAPQPTHTSFMISDILHSTCSSKNVRHPQPPTTTTYISTSHHPVYAANYPVNTADESAYSEGRDSPRSVISDDGDCKEREGSVGASDSDVERTGAC